jgi:hypothetical protein
MGEVFTSQPGCVAVIDSQQVVPGLVKIGGFDPELALISKHGMQQSANIQFKPSLDRDIYAYAFGDAMGEVHISGMAFTAACVGGGSGLSEVLEFYASARASVQPDTVIVAMGEKTIAGYLTRLRTEGRTASGGPLANSDGLDMTHTEFDLFIAALPPEI